MPFTPRLEGVDFLISTARNTWSIDGFLHLSQDSGFAAERVLRLFLVAARLGGSGTYRGAYFDATFTPCSIAANVDIDVLRPKEVN